jgi:hypothetical protein
MAPEKGSQGGSDMPPCPEVTEVNSKKRERLQLDRRNRMRSVDELCPPFYVVPIPINAEGQGPEMDPAKEVGVCWEVWDGLFLAVCTAGDEDIARLIAQRLNG